MVRDVRRYRFLLVLGALAICFGGMRQAWADALALRVKVPGGIADRGGMKKLLTKELRKNLLNEGFVIRPGSQFMLVVNADVEESGGTSDPPSCIIALRLQLVMSPENREVFTASANGRANFSRAVALDKTKREQLRRQATSYAARALIRPLRGYMEQVKEKLRSLPKGHKLGRSLGKRTRRGGGGGTGTGAAPAGRPGKPLPGRPPERKLLPAGVDWEGNKPPLAVESEPEKKK
ncbi:MAG: hypothetical protein H6727_04050 [Myxococcales bacterium]|nr:hypothetical protein [Myxococcales bacterium]